MATVKLRSRNGGRKKLTTEQVRHVKDFTAWALDRLLGNRLSERIGIDVVMDSTLFAKQGVYGTAIWEDTHRRSREFTLEVDTSAKFSTVMNTIAHELVHVKQWASGEYYAIDTGAYVYRYRGATHDTRVTDYWELPWEVEAYGRSIGLLVMWIRAAGLEGAEWTKQEITLA